MTVSKDGAKHREQGHTYHSDEVEAIYLACVHISPDHAHGACGDCTHKAAIEGARVAEIRVFALQARIDAALAEDHNANEAESAMARRRMREALTGKKAQ